MSSSASEPGAGRVYRPTDLREASDAIREATASGPVVVRGAGTASEWGAPVSGVPTVLDTTGLDRLAGYDPADMTVTVGAGMPLSRLQQQLTGQWVALDAPRVAEGATVGGLLATSDAGPSRLVYGSMRDLVIGATVILADGTLARTGGQVIKNVAGYDLGRLFAGSLGTFGVLAELVLRVHPLPETTATIHVECDPGAAYAFGDAILGSPLDPRAVDWVDGVLLARFEGTEAGVARRVDRAMALLGEAGAGDPGAVTGEDERTLWSGRVADAGRGAPGDTVLRAGTPPRRFTELAHLAGGLAGKVEQAQGERIGVSLDGALGVGALTLTLSGGSARATAAIAEPWRAAALADGGSATLQRRTSGLTDLMPAWGPPPPSVGALRSIKAALDPTDRLAPGRFAPWY